MRPLTRRRVLIGGTALLASRLARAQKPSRLPAVGVLNPHAPPPGEQLAKSPMRSRMRQLGWIDGETVQYVDGFGFGNDARLPELAAALVRKIESCAAHVRATFPSRCQAPTRRR